jgi:NADH dehydrogenase
MIYLTGASGFVGGNVLPALLAKGWRVRALLLPEEVPPLENPRLEWVRGDIRRNETLVGHLQGIETVVHIAGVVASADEALNYQVNYLGTKHLVDLAKTVGVAKFVHMSAAAVKFRAKTAYGRTKKMAEDYIIASDLPYVILRTPLILGKGCQEFERFLDYLNTLPFVVPVFGNGRAVKRPVHIGDVVEAVVASVEDEKALNKIYEIACREEVTLNELIDATLRQWGQRKVRVHIPMSLSLALASMAEKILGARAPVTRDILLGMAEDVEFEVEDSLVELNVKPLSVAEALARSI